MSRSTSGGKNAPKVEREIAALWEAIEAWFRDHGVGAVEQLQRGATDRRIEAFETEAGVSLPADYRASLGVHDGDATLHDYDYLSLDRVKGKWSMMSELLDDGAFDDKEPEGSEGVIRKVWWHRKWIPFAADSAGNLLVIDLAPGRRGKKGQIVRMETATGPEPTGVDSFLEWLRRYRSDLESDQYRVDEYGYLIER
jgi:cell wall assembly regulator SMI1